MAHLDGSKSGGRQKGSVAKNRREEVRQELEKQGFNPLEVLVRLATHAEAEGDLPVAVKATSELCAYLHPKLRVMTVTGDTDEPVVFNITTGSLPLSESLQILKEAADAEGLTPPIEHEPEPEPVVSIVSDAPATHNKRAEPPERYMSTETDVRSEQQQVDWDSAVDNWNSSGGSDLV